MQQGPDEPRGRNIGGPQRDRMPLARFEAFLFSAVATVLVTRAYLAVTGYPQIGGGNLHVAHVLWGGLLMGVAVVTLVIVPGRAVMMRGALVGGIGFGLFIDEIGKFLTKDVDYFFRPAIAIMYVVFVGFYLVVRVVLQRRRLTDELRLAAGLDALSDQARGQLARSERELATALLLEVSDPALRPMATRLVAALAADAMGRTTAEHWLTTWRDRLSRGLDRLLAGTTAQRVVLGAFVLQAVLSVVDIALVLLGPGRVSGNEAAGPVATASSGVVTVMVIVGVTLLLRGRLLASLRMLHSALVVNLLVSQVFLFASNQFGALVGFVVALAMVGVLRRAISNVEAGGAVFGKVPASRLPAQPA